MATDEQKKKNLLRLMDMTLLSVSAGVWNVMGESVFASAGRPMGDNVLQVLEKEMGLEIAGETPKDVLMEIGRIFVDEFGFAGQIDVEEKGENEFEIKVTKCINRKFTDKLMAAGVKKPFICPIMNTSEAALRRMGFVMRNDIEKWVAGEGSIITFTGI